MTIFRKIQTGDFGVSSLKKFFFVFREILFYICRGMLDVLYSAIRVFCVGNTVN